MSPLEFRYMMIRIHFAQRRFRCFFFRVYGAAKYIQILLSMQVQYNPRRNCEGDMKSYLYRR